METGLVAHLVERAEWFYLILFCAIEVASGWTECLPVWGKGQQRVRSAVHRMRQPYANRTAIWPIDKLQNILI